MAEQLPQVQRDDEAEGEREGAQHGHILAVCAQEPAERSAARPTPPRYKASPASNATPQGFRHEVMHKQLPDSHEAAQAHRNA